MTEITMVACGAGWSDDALERDLIVRARYDRAAFAALYRRHYGAIAGYVYRRVGDVHATEDLVAETFLAALRSIGGYRSRGVPLRAWLYRIATNVVNRWAKQRRRLLQREGEPLHAWSERPAADGDSNDGGHSAGPAVCVWSMTGCDGDAAGARRALLLLPPQQQAVVALHYLEGLAVEEVADVMGCRVGTVKSRLSRGRDALRDILNGGR